MKNLGKIIKSAICVSVCAAAAMTMSSCKSYSKMIREQPEEYISMASENTARAMVRGSFADEYALFEEAVKNGSLSLEFKAEDISFDGDFYANESEEMFSSVCTLTGSNGASAKIYAYAGKNSVRFGTDGQSGSHIYELSLDNFAEKLAVSIFAPDSGSEYAMPQSNYDRYIKNIEEISDAVSGSASVENKYKEIIDDYILSHKPITEEKADADIGGETVKSNIFTYTIPTEDVKMLAEQIIDVVLEEYDSDSGYFTKDMMKSQMMEMLDDIEECGIEIIYYINSKTNVLMKMDCTADLTVRDETAQCYFSAFYGADPETAENQGFKFGAKTDGEETDFVIDIAHTETRSDISVTMNEDGETAELFMLTGEKVGEDYAISLEIPEEGITAKVIGTIAADKNSFTLTVDKISVSDGPTELSYSPEGVVGVRKGGEALVLDAEKNFLDITEEEMDSLLEDIEADFSAVFDIES